MASLPELYEELKGTRVRQGELVVPGFDDADYEALFEELIDQLRDFIGSNYEYWYTRQCLAYHRFKARNTTTWDFYDPQLKPMMEQSTREQLATLKFFLYRRTYSNYGRK